MTMTLKELLQIQEELNSHCPEKPNYEQLEWAILDELGEFAKSRKGEWAWWTRYGQGFENKPREEQCEELADILCFLLTGLLKDIESGHFLNYKINPGWDFSGNVYQSKPGDILFRCVEGSYNGAIISFQGLIRDAGFTREEVEAAYLVKVEENKKRWEAKAE